MQFVEPWFAIEDDGATGANSVVAELKRELAEGHKLFNQTVRLVARRQDCDDFLFEYMGHRIKSLRLFI